MNIITDSNKTIDNDFWVISESTYSDINLEQYLNGGKISFVKEYRISDLAWYLLNPNAVKVKKRLVGYEAHKPQAFFYRLRLKIRKILARPIRVVSQDSTSLKEVRISDKEIRPFPLNDDKLESHMNRIYEALRPYDSMIKEIAKLDIVKISDLVGICKDLGGFRSFLTIQGDCRQKIDYLIKNLNKEITVSIPKAYIAEGLFEMSGFDFKGSDPKVSHRLVTFLHNNQPYGCVLSSYNTISYWIEDLNILNYIHFLHYAIKTDYKLNDSLGLCLKGQGFPLKLMFNNRLAIDYSSNLPKIYRDVFETHNIEKSKKQFIINYLKNAQFGISLNYLHSSNSGEKKLVTALSVMHDINALEPIKHDLPDIYSEIDKRAYVFETGKFYLLDGIRGFSNE